MWYVLIFVSIVVLIASKRASSSRRPPSGVGKLLGTPTICVAIASVVMLLVLAQTHLAAPPAAQIKEQRRATELHYRQAVGFALSRQILSDHSDPKGIVVVALKPSSPPEEALLYAFFEGIVEAADGIPVEQNLIENISLVDNKGPTQLATNRRLGVADLESTSRTYPDADVLICYSAPPVGYGESAFASRIANNNFSIGFLLYDVYSLGQEIFSGKITACAIPQRRLSYPLETELEPDLMKAAHERYHILSAGNIQRFALKNRRMIHIARAQ